MEREIISADSLAKAVGIQESVNLSFGRTAQAMGLLTPDEVSQVSRAQRTLDMLYGGIAVKMGFLTDSQVTLILAEQRRNHLYIGEALVKIGALDRKNLNPLLNEFEREQAPFKMTGLELPDNVPMPHLCMIVWDTSKKMLSRLTNLIIKPGPCELVKKIEGNNLAVVVDFAGDVPIRYVMTWPAVVRKNIALSALHNGNTQFDAVFTVDNSAFESVSNFVNITCGQITAKASDIGINLSPVKCDVSDNDDNILINEYSNALLFPFYLTTGEWLDLAIIFPT